jgi:hypothetical protein
MHSTQHHAIRTRLLQPLAASALIVAGLFTTANGERPDKPTAG